MYIKQTVPFISINNGTADAEKNICVCAAGLDEIGSALASGASKIALGFASAADLGLIREAAAAFGSGRVALAIETRKKGDSYWEVYTPGGAAAHMDAFGLAVAAEKLGAGEIVLSGPDAGELAELVSPCVGVPVSVSCPEEESAPLCEALSA